MVLVLSTIGLLVLLFLIMFVLVRAFDANSVADIIDWKPTRSPEVEAQNEVDDVRQMIEETRTVYDSLYAADLG